MMQQPTTTELRFRYSQASATEIQTVVNEILVELRNETSDAAQQAREVGLDPSLLASAEITVDEQGHGFEPTLTTILIGISIRVGSHVAKQFFNEVLWPRLRRRLGAKVLGEELKDVE